MVMASNEEDQFMMKSPQYGVSPVKGLHYEATPVHLQTGVGQSND